MARKNYTQQELCNEVYAAVLNASEPLTRREICEAIGRKKSPHILAMIEGLVSTGYLTKGTTTNAQWGQGYVYSAASNSSGEACKEVA